MDKRLIGKTVLTVLIDEEKEILSFQTDNGKFNYETEIDCCNDVWFNHMDGIDALIGGTVLDVEEASYSDWIKVPEVTRQDVDEVAFWTIKTNKGHCKIEVRNSHNGYYGGGVSYKENTYNYKKFQPLLEDF